jgi:hypothetical protein
MAFKAIFKKNYVVGTPCLEMTVPAFVFLSCRIILHINDTGMWYNFLGREVI